MVARAGSPPVEAATQLYSAVTETVMKVLLRTLAGVIIGYAVMVLLIGHTTMKLVWGVP